MRVGSNVKSDNFTAYDTPITYTHSIVQCRESIPCVATTSLYAHAQSLHRRFLQEKWNRFPQVRTGQDPDFDKQHADTHRGMRWPHKVLILVAGQSVCV